MRPGARLTAAAEILDAMAKSHRPASEALRDWGTAHRFAGSADRGAIGNLVFDALRRRSSMAHLMGADTSRALVLGVVRFLWGEPVETLRQMVEDTPHAPGALSAQEEAALAGTTLEGATLEGAPGWVAGDVPEWLYPSFERVFAGRAAEVGASLAARAPMDIRANTLKAPRDKLEKTLKSHHPHQARYSPHGLRIAAPEKSARAPHLQSDAAFRRGWFEVQDEGSQIAALMCGAKAGMQVADICAGAGGKTLALAAAMGGKGQVYAYDADKRRLAPIFERIARARADNVRTLKPGDVAALKPLQGKMDIVLADAPCTGSGVWRRRPDAKWRLSERALNERMAEQDAVLDMAAPLVRPGGRLVYVTCSLLAAENADRVDAFLGRHGGFAKLPYAQGWGEAFAAPAPASSDGGWDALLLTPLDHGTDGFFIQILARNGG